MCGDAINSPQKVRSHICLNYNSSSENDLWQLGEDICSPPNIFETVASADILSDVHVLPGNFFLYGNPVDHNFCASTISKRLQRQPEHMNSKQSGVAVSDLCGCISQQEQNDILVSRVFIKQSIFLFIFAIQTHWVFQGLPTDTLTGSKVEAARDKIQQINNPVFLWPKGTVLQPAGRFLKLQSSKATWLSLPHTPSLLFWRFSVRKLYYLKC